MLACRFFVSPVLLLTSLCSATALLPHIQSFINQSPAVVFIYSYCSWFWLSSPLDGVTSNFINFLIYFSASENFMFIFPKASGEAETAGWGAAGAAGRGAGAGAVGAESQSAGGAEGTGSSWFSTVKKQSVARAPSELQESITKFEGKHTEKWTVGAGSPKMVLDCCAAKASSVSAGEVSSEVYSCAGAKPLQIENKPRWWGQR